MNIEIDIARRYGKQRAHTATHLLHAVLQTYFPMTKQEGSYVGDDELRFDFAAEALLSNNDLVDITNKINEYIHQALPVTQQIMKYDEAIALGAKAFFADTYGEEVRVLQVQGAENPVSTELCGGNHVENTADIGAFTIVSQEAVAAGVKRIHAYTGPRVIEKLQESDTLLQGLVAATGLKQSAQLPEKIEKILKEYDALQDANKEMKQSMLSLLGKNNTTLFASPIDLAEIRKQLTGLTNQDILFFLENTKEYNTVSRIAFADNEDGTSVVTVYDPVDQKAKEKAQQLGVQGGGTDKKVTGKMKQHFPR